MISALRGKKLKKSWECRLWQSQSQFYCQFFYKYENVRLNHSSLYVYKYKTRKFSSAVNPSFASLRCTKTTEIEQNWFYFVIASVNTVTDELKVVAVRWFRVFTHIFLLLSLGTKLEFINRQIWTKRLSPSSAQRYFCSCLLPFLTYDIHFQSITSCSFLYYHS